MQILKTDDEKQVAYKRTHWLLSCSHQETQRYHIIFQKRKHTRFRS